MDRGSTQATVDGVAKSRTWLSIRAHSTKGNTIRKSGRCQGHYGNKIIIKNLLGTTLFHAGY